ncbi:hypothetical protein [Salisediminibacterium selenitireducens]|uniref:Uncharacterized protein n=1 Tax=Bacillus selenitireducens (strain ATCC 700615 / DSM 15326 / MLS10) TaxID=439292 RepID=D6XVZ1_BACIE|nr:hypothetical protein [Salisediminibacterium selenitireducens]ADH97764.1 hypothetical protein Bsel_0218 [[Bacillus] selenitireducens MLS10]
MELLFFLVIGVVYYYNHKKIHNYFQREQLFNNEANNLQECATNSVVMSKIYENSSAPYFMIKDKNVADFNHDLFTEFHNASQLFHHDQEFQKEMNDSHNPYVNPGQDIIVDESYHGIDHGIGIANPSDHHDHNNHN